jgi:hypothetical protein
LAEWLSSGRQDILCKPNLDDSANYDAVITFPNGAKITRLFIEFTCAKSGYEDSLRMEVLNNNGRVNMLGEVTHSGTKNTGHRIEVTDEVVPRLRTLEKHRRLIIDRINAKASKKYGPDHILVVVFDDFLSFRTDRDITDLKSAVASETNLSALNFGSLYLLGSSGKTVSKMPLKD